MPYCIKPDYQERLNNDPCPQIGYRDECQNEVYLYAHRLPFIIDRVIDVGTGSGFKLMKYFHNRYTLGTDIEPNLSLVQELYPEVGWKQRHWKLSDLTSQDPGFDLMICADVIEHLVDPDVLMAYIKRSAPSYLVISTPERNTLQEHFWNGPPRNPAHVREWAANEFAGYVGSWFNIMEHVLPSPGSSTQFILATMR